MSDMFSTFRKLAASLPEALRADTLRNWEQLLSACDKSQCDWFEQALSDEPFAKQLLTSLACSQAFGELLRKQPQALIELSQSGELNAKASRKPDFSPAEPIEAQVDLDRALRCFRNRHWLRIVWRDLNGLADTAATTRDLSRLAECCLEAALDFHHRQLVREWGQPCNRDGEPQHFVIVAMGKLGAGELNLSSDVDLMFTYPESGQTVGGARQVDNQQFFIKLGQRLIASIDQRTADGFVFRVDMRLRPYGQSGPLVINFDAMEEYYQDQGREWERYAMIKARAVAGDIAAGARLLHALKPFVYRRYIDFSVIEALRDMKRMIRREVQRRQLQDNIKLGSGGIREVEFIAQCFQLVRGGREQSLQERRLMTVLDELQVLDQLPAEAVQELKAAYNFLRDSEHAIQAWLDRQTQQLPRENKERAALAWVMGFEGEWQAYADALEQHRSRVAALFEDVIAEPDHAAELEVSKRPWEDLLEMADSEALLCELQSAEFDDADEVARLLLAMLDSSAVKRMQNLGRERLYDFLPLLLDACGEAQQPGRCFLRILPLVESVLRRTAYLVLLMENPGALSRLVRLCDASPWISRQLSRNPVLLDELLNEHSLYSVPDKEGLYSELRQQLLRIPEEDQEAQMEALRYFKLAHVLRVAASEIVGTLPLMKVSDYLSAIAEVVLSHVLEMAWQTLRERHGDLPGTDTDLPFIVVAYGKLGGLELNYGSDLDLVFIHDVDAGAVSSGDRALDGGTFFTRLGQRMIHILTATTGLGQLYDVDMRLRPSGNSGLLVSSFGAFADYQQGSAWTWEHQALARARGVAGCSDAIAAFESLRHEVLCTPRERETLRETVVDMREKMRASLGTPVREGADPDAFHTKHDRGGIVDIEFMVQYLMLAYSSEYPELTRWSDNIRQMEALGDAGVIPVEDAEKLRETYITLRSTIHRRALQNLNSKVEPDAFPDERAYIWKVWQRIMLDPG